MGGLVLGAELRTLAEELALHYLGGDLVLIAGAGVSRTSGMPGWAEMVESIQTETYPDLPGMDEQGFEAVLNALHRTDPISRADTLQRLATAPSFRKRLHTALFGGLPAGETYRPSIVHWTLASLVDHGLMTDLFTSNYDDLLEDAKKALGRSGRVRHFHGRLPQAWTGSTVLDDPPVVTSRDYMSAEAKHRYDKIAVALGNKTALLVGFSLSDPNLIRIIRDNAKDCRAIVVASPGGLDADQQALRLKLLRGYWRGLNIDVTAIEAHEELPAFLTALRRRILRGQGTTPSALGEEALRVSMLANPWTWQGAGGWRIELKDAVVAAKLVARSVTGDRTLRAGFYAIESDGFLTHLVSSDSTQRSYSTWPRRRLKADDDRPWGAAGYCWAAGVPISSMATGSAFDRNVPESNLLAWQAERAAQRRLPAASVLCVPACLRYRRSIVIAGVLYFSSHRATAFSHSKETQDLRQVLEQTFSRMMKPDRVIKGGLP